MIAYCHNCNKHIDLDSDADHFMCDNDCNPVREDDVEGDGICSACNGSGEGMNEFVRCRFCNGTGSE